MYLCRFAGAEHRRSVGLLTNVQALSSNMYLGWPSFNTTLDSVLQCLGPLPASCPCSTTHPSPRGHSAKGGFKSFSAQTLGPRFWARILSKMQDSQLRCSLGDGVSSVPSSSAGMITSGGKVPYGFALSAGPRVGVSTPRGLEGQQTHKVYFERLLFGEAGQLLRVEGLGSRRSMWWRFSRTSGVVDAIGKRCTRSD